MKSVFCGLKTQNNMDIKLKYRAWVGEKHADIASHLTNSDIETFAIEFAEWLVKNCFIPDVITSNFLDKNGGIFVGEGTGISSIQYKFEKDADCEACFLLTWNGYDDTWTYKDYRNRVYGLRFKEQLQALLLILGLRWEDYFAE